MDKRTWKIQLFPKEKAVLPFFHTYSLSNNEYAMLDDNVISQLNATFKYSLNGDITLSASIAYSLLGY